MKRAVAFFAGILLLGFGAVWINGFQNTLEFGLNNIDTLEIEVRGDRLFLNGIINARALEQFEIAIAENPQVNALTLGDIPGSIDDDVNIALGYLVRELGLGTHLLADSDVRSGGVDLFLAGDVRTMEAGAVMGVHSWTDNSVDGADLPKTSPEHALTRDYVEAMLGRDDFYWFTLAAAPSDGIYLMSRDDIRNFGLLTD